MKVIIHQFSKENIHINLTSKYSSVGNVYYKIGSVLKLPIDQFQLIYNSQILIQYDLDYNLFNDTTDIVDIYVVHIINNGDVNLKLVQKLREIYKLTQVIIDKYMKKEVYIHDQARLKNMYIKLFT